MAVPIAFDLESPTWLRRLRWISIFGQAIAVLLAEVLGVQFEALTALLVLMVLGVWNFFLPQLEERIFFSSKGFLLTQIIVDVFFLTIVLWMSGGLVNPFASFYVLQVIIAGLLLTPRMTLSVSIFVSLGIISLLWAPAMLVRGSAIELSRISPLWFGLPLALILEIILVTAFIWIYLDRLGRAQSQLSQRIKMGALGRLVAGLAHELGTPLNSILVLSQDMQSALDAEHKPTLATIAKEARRCGEIVSLLLGYSRTLRSGEIKYSPVFLEDWLKNIFSQISAKRAFRTQPLFSVEVHDLPESVEIPELILRQVLENLLKNALDAVADRDEPKIRINAYSDPYEAETILVVEDNGPGFSKEARDQAFEAFYTTKPPGVGTGLGLYISYYLLAQIGGRILIEDHNASGNGSGAKIQVAFPWPQERKI